MLQDKIKFYRKQNHLSQEELAFKLNVVRQTVSKWEQGLSVPDADILIKIANIFHVSVQELLEVNVESSDLHTELTCLNKELNRKNEDTKIKQQIEQKRNKILFLSFIALLTDLIVHQDDIVLVMITICCLASLAILAKNISLLSSVNNRPTKPQMNALKITTCFTVVIFLSSLLFSFMMKRNFIHDYFAEMLVVGLISVLILFGGFISVKLPFTRHTGLRLPWTIQDEATWNVAHKLIHLLSLPLVLIYLALVFTTKDVKVSTTIIFLSWILIPSLFSFFFYVKYFKR